MKPAIVFRHFFSEVYVLLHFPFAELIATDTNNRRSSADVRQVIWDDTQ